LQQVAFVFEPHPRPLTFEGEGSSTVLFFWKVVVTFRIENFKLFIKLPTKLIAFLGAFGQFPEPHYPRFRPLAFKK
jgi:hypothetical protein